MIQLIIAMGMMLANASMYYCSLEDETLGDCDSVGWQLEAPQTYAVTWPHEDIRHELGPCVGIHLVDDLVVLKNHHISPLVSDGQSDWTGQTVGDT